MYREIKKLFKHSGIYALGVGTQALLGFLLVPLYTRILSGQDYGRLEILQTFLKVLLFLVPLGFASALQKCYHRDAKDFLKKKQFISTAFLFIIPLGMIELLILAFFAAPLSRFLVGLSFPLIVYLLLATSFFAVFLELGLSLLRAQERSKYYTALFLLRFGITLGFTIYLVAGLKFGLAGVVLGNLLGQGLASFFALPYLLNYVRISYSSHALTKLLKFGLPIVPASVAMWVMDLSDRYFLRFFAGFTEVGIYSVGYRIGFILEVLLVIPFQLAWPAFSFRIAKLKGHVKVYSRVFTYVFLAGIFGVLVLTLFAPQLIRILAPAFYGKAVLVVPLVSLSYVLYGLHFVLAPGIHLREKTAYYPFLILGPALLNIGLNFYFVPAYGMFGAAITTLISFVLVVLLTYFLSHHFYPLKLEWRRLFKVLVMGLIVYGLFVLELWSAGVLQILFKVALLLFYPIGLWALGFLNFEEERYLRLISQKIKERF